MSGWCSSSTVTAGAGRLPVADCDDWDALTPSRRRDVRRERVEQGVRNGDGSRTRRLLWAVASLAMCLDEAADAGDVDEGQRTVLVHRRGRRGREAGVIGERRPGAGVEDMLDEVRAAADDRDYASVTA